MNKLVPSLELQKGGGKDTAEWLVVGVLLRVIREEHGLFVAMLGVMIPLPAMLHIVVYQLNQD